MTSYDNPFPNDPDRRELWDMLVRRDIDAFVAGDWSQVADDFDAENFFAVDGRASGNPDSWRITAFDAYRASWLEQSAQTNAEIKDVREALFAATTLRDIEIVGDDALLHKKFDGTATRFDGSTVVLRWQTLYQCRKRDGRWRIAGFVGYLPNPMGVADTAVTPVKRVPVTARQHVTAGPYSPVLEVRPGGLVVISGQVAVAEDGSVVGETVEDQTRQTIDNCRAQLAEAGCGLGDVFKVNVYLRDLAEWPRFNTVYRDLMPDPLPVRTAVGVDLLDGLRVEIEMWAVKP